MIELRVGDGDSGNSGNCTGQGSLDKIKLPKIYQDQVRLVNGSAVE